MFAWLKNWWKSLWEEECECVETDCPSADECCELDGCCAAEPDEVHAVPTFHEYDIIELHLDEFPTDPEPEPEPTPELVEYTLPVFVCPDPEPPAKPKKARAPRKTAVKKAVKKPKKATTKTVAKKKK